MFICLVGWAQNHYTTMEANTNKDSRPDFSLVLKDWTWTWQKRLQTSLGLGRKDLRLDLTWTCKHLWTKSCWIALIHTREKKWKRLITTKRKHGFCECYTYKVVCLQTYMMPPPPPPHSSSHPIPFHASLSAIFNHLQCYTVKHPSAWWELGMTHRESSGQWDQVKPNAYPRGTMQNTCIQYSAYSRALTTWRLTGQSSWLLTRKVSVWIPGILLLVAFKSRCPWPKDRVHRFNLVDISGKTEVGLRSFQL